MSEYKSLMTWLWIVAVVLVVIGAIYVQQDDKVISKTAAIICLVLGCIVACITCCYCCADTKRNVQRKQNAVKNAQFFEIAEV